MTVAVCLWVRICVRVCVCVLESEKAAAVALNQMEGNWDLERWTGVGGRVLWVQVWNEVKTISCGPNILLLRCRSTDHHGFRSPKMPNAVFFTIAKCKSCCCFFTISSSSISSSLEANCWQTTVRQLNYVSQTHTTASPPLLKCIFVQTVAMLANSMLRLPLRWQTPCFIIFFNDVKTFNKLYTVLVCRRLNTNALQPVRH